MPDVSPSHASLAAALQLGEELRELEQDNNDFKNFVSIFFVDFCNTS